MIQRYGTTLEDRIGPHLTPLPEGEYVFSVSNSRHNLRAKIAQHFSAGMLSKYRSKSREGRQNRGTLLLFAIFIPALKRRAIFMTLNTCEAR